MPEPTLSQLRIRANRLAEARTPLNITVYRSATPAYANESDILTGEGSRRTGGRWNPVGIAVVYASFSPETAMAETLAHARYYGLPVEDAMPKTFVAIEVKLGAILDLREGSIRQRLRLSARRILDIDWRKEWHEGREPITRQFGRVVHELGWEGIVVPSAADREGLNLLIFPDNLAPESSLRVLHAEKL